MKNKIIGERLKKLREEVKFSIQEVARYFDNDTELIEMWEKGDSQPNVEQMLILSFLYGINMDDILQGIKPIELVSEELREEYRYEAWANRMGKKMCG